MPKKDSAKTTVFELTISYEIVEDGSKLTLTQRIEDEAVAKKAYRYAVSNYKPNKVVGRRLTKLDITTARTDISTSGKILLDE
jgi:hypothetical protein